MTTTLPAIVTEPGVYELTDEQYHGDPVPGGSLSSTGARKLLPPSCPARFKWELDNPQPRRRAFDIGHAAHRLVLGAGADIAPIVAPDWKTKAAREQRDDAYAAGMVPVLLHEFEQVQAMAHAIRRHPVAAALFNPDAGLPEQSLFWVDDQTGVWRRARLDWLPNARNGRLIVADLKTTESAEPGHIQRAVHNYGYHAQAAYYIDGIKALGLDDEPAFVFVFVEKAPPHLVTVVQVDAEAEQIGRDLNRRAIDLYAKCKATDTWPPYSTDIELISLPAWASRQHEENQP